MQFGLARIPGCTATVCQSIGSRRPARTGQSPTAACRLEWEYAAAADETRRDARGDQARRRRILGWYEYPVTAALPAVGGPANAYGVCDLHGVV